MELRQLQYFVAVADEGQFTRAAAAVSVAQPAISVQIQRLEAELGERLLHRDRRSVRLTDAGEAFLPHARAAVAAARRGRDTVASLRRVLTGRLRVGTAGPADARLATALGAFHREHPAVELRLTAGTNEATIAEIADGTLDVALVGAGAQPLPPAVQSRVVAVEPLVAVVAPGHPLAHRRRLRAAELRDEPLITFVRGSGLRLILERAARAAGFAPRIVAEAGDLHALVDLAAAGLGLAVVPRSVAETARAQVRVLAIADAAFERRTALAWHATASSPAARAFLAVAATAFDGEAAPPGL